MSSWRSRRRAPQPPPAVAAAAVTTAGERLLAAACVAGADTWLVATSVALVQVTPEGRPLGRHVWHDVDAASWDRDSSVLTVTWVDRSTPARWPLGGEPTFLAVLRERVQASVVLAEDVLLPGRHRARVALRQDFSSGALVEQVSGDAEGGDPASSRAVDEALTRLREQAGLPPPGP